MNLANEGLEARKKEEEVTSRKRKAEEDKAWEGMFDFYLQSACLAMCEANCDCITSPRHSRTTCRQLEVVREREEEKEKQSPDPWMIWYFFLYGTYSLLSIACSHLASLAHLQSCRFGGPTPATQQHQHRHRSTHTSHLHLPPVVQQ
jgi:hypothetical protein